MGGVYSVCACRGRWGQAEVSPGPARGAPLSLSTIISGLSRASRAGRAMVLWAHSGILAFPDQVPSHPCGGLAALSSPIQRALPAPLPSPRPLHPYTHLLSRRSMMG